MFGKYYLIPNRDVVIVGGTAQENDWNLEVSPQDTENIWNGVCEAFPSLKNATIVSRYFIVIIIIVIKLLIIIIF